MTIGSEMLTVPGGATLASSRVADALREAILNGKLEPGSRVRQEALASEYGFSRIPVREALRLLESEGLVVLVPNSGAWVSKLDRAECIEIYKIRERVEPLALIESCQNLTPSRVDELSMLAKRIEQAADSDAFLRLDREFHIISYAGAKMPRLQEMIHKFWNTTQHYRRAFTAAADPTSMSAVYSEHSLIVDALHRKDGEHAGLILQGHIRRTRLKLQESGEIFEGARSIRTL